MAWPLCSEGRLRLEIEDRERDVGRGMRVSKSEGPSLIAEAITDS